MYCNLRSASNKLLEIKELIYSKNIKLFSFTETWLKSSDSNTIFSLTDYTIFRKDRLSRGGGVLIGVHNSLPSCEVNLNCNYEILAVDIQPKHINKVRIICVYNPKGADTLTLKNIISILCTLILNCKHYIIIGDFNVDSLGVNNTSTSHSLLSEFIDLHFPAKQLIYFPTHGIHAIDYLITNDYNMIGEITCLPPIGKSDHNTIFTNLNINFINHRRKFIYIKNFNKANFNNIIEYINTKFIPNNDFPANLNWETISNTIN